MSFLLHSVFVHRVVGMAFARFVAFAQIALVCVVQIARFVACLGYFYQIEICFHPVVFVRFDQIVFFQ